MSLRTKKVEDIMKAYSKSELAKERGYKAEVLPDGRIQYSRITKTKTGRPYREKITFREALMPMYGPDMRNIYRKYGKAKE